MSDRRQKSSYSRIFLRQPSNKFTGSWIDSPSAMSTPQHQRNHSQGYSYPSNSSTLSPDMISPNKSPPPHPYTLGATRSPVTAVFDQRTQREGRRDEEKQEVKQEQEHRPQDSHLRSNAAQPLPEPLKLGHVPLFLLYLPLPPLLSMIYMVCGHAILRRATSTVTYTAPIVTSLEAGATGGVILAIPLAVILYFLLLFPTRSLAAPEDFFEDDTSSIAARQRWTRNMGVGASALFAVCIGGMAGPLGVVCLSHGLLAAFVDARRILSPSSAAAAGFLGGGVIGLGLIFVGAAWCTGRMLRMGQTES